MKVRNPRNGAFDYLLSVDSTDQVKDKSLQLRQAQQSWKERSLEERITVIEQFAASIERNDDEIFDQLSVDTGRRKISRIEIDGIIDMIRGKCVAVKYLSGQSSIRQSMTNATVQIKQEREPYELVGVISPWNFPLLLALIDTVSALLAGCTVLLKPSEVTPRFIDGLERAIRETSGLEDVLQVVRGGAEVGQALVDHVDAVCFTGSVATGKKIALRCAERFIPAFLELGGKDPAIVLASANLEITTDAILRSCAGATGQACQSLERIYVDHSIYDAFLAMLCKKAGAVTFNDDYQEGGTLGPIIFNKQAAKINAQLKEAVQQGAKIHTGGEIQNIKGGLWLAPTVITEVNHEMTIMKEETFGPVLPVISFSSIDEAIAFANDSRFGLSASVFGEEEEACRVASRIDAGGISINDASLTNQVFDAEKNSFKESGLNGSRMGADGFLRFFRKKALLIQKGKPADIHTQDE